MYISPIDLPTTYPTSDPTPVPTDPNAHHPTFKPTK